jgi:hypothetical protein
MLPRLCISLLIALTATAGATFVQSSQTYTIDFVAERAAVRNEPTVGKTREASGSGFGEGARAIPFEVTLISLDRNGYDIGDPVFYELRVKYVGSAPFPFPWTRDSGDLLDAARVERASFLLHFDDPMLGSHLLGNENTLFGSASVPGSTIRLTPGDIIDMRGEGRWALTHATRRPPGANWLKHLAVTGQLQIAGVNDVIPIVDSRNSVKVRLQQK